MEAATLAAEPAPNTSRLRLVALLLMSWQDIPISGSRIRGKPGRGVERRVSMTTQELDEGIRRAEELGNRPARRIDERASAGNVVELAAMRTEHPAHRALADAMTELDVLDPFGAKLLRWAFVGQSGVDALARAHSLEYVHAGPAPVETPRYRMVRALVGLDDLLPRGLVFPRSLYAQERAWETWLDAIRPKLLASGKREGRADIDDRARRERNTYIRQLAEAGLTQRSIAARLGLSQPMVARVLQVVES